MDDDILCKVFRALNDEGVRYALFGGLAVAAHGLSRATKDIDLFLDQGEENTAAMLRALRRVFDDPEISDITSADLEEYGLVRYGVRDYDFVIDLTRRIGEAFSFADLAIELADFAGEKVPVVSPGTLVRMKRSTGRPQDLADVLRLRERFSLDEDGN
jgi:predicted nucleotidyltransferase